MKSSGEKKTAMKKNAENRITYLQQEEQSA